MGPDSRGVRARDLGNEIIPPRVFSCVLVKVPSGSLDACDTLRTCHTEGGKMKFKELDGNEIRLDDVSFVGKVDRHINYGHQGSSNMTYYIPMVVGGQRVEVKGKDKDHAEAMRADLIGALKK